jgi:beta-galactosidase
MRKSIPPLSCLTIFIVAGFVQVQARENFKRAFAPQDGLVSRYEMPQRDEICLDGHWFFQGDADTTPPTGDTPSLGAWDQTEIKIPSPWNVNGFFAGGAGGDFRAYPSYPDNWQNVEAAWMERDVHVPKSWGDERILLHFSAVAGMLIVYVNGHRVGQGFDIFFAQEFDVTPWIKIGGTNQVLVKVIAPKVFDKPGNYGHREYLSGSFWGTYIAGIWQDVFLVAEPKIAVSDIFVQPWVNRDELRVEATLENHGLTAMTVEAGGDVREWINLTDASALEAPEVKWKLASKKNLSLTGERATLLPGESKRVTLTAKVNGRLKLWSPDYPNLYGLLLTVTSNGRTLDTKYQRFGWRQFSIDGNKLCLNGQPITLHGDSWHFLGVPQMTRRYAYAWYRLLKDAGANAVRLHASIYPSFYHDVADEMGIMILDESAIWASDGGPKADSDLFWKNCQTNVAELVMRDRNHPSVFGWSVCNEILPVLRNVWHAPQDMIDHCLDQISVWEAICQTNDPTRGWISGDGEWDAEGRLPIINIHYGGENEMERAANSGKPWAVGETSMAYYGTPRQVSAFNGNQAYESDRGRMEGLTYESYGLLRGQQKFGGNYQSVFNIVWYSVQPLPLGKRDIAKPVSLDDGIFFTPYKEGIPGMQPERLGPYISTLNPGYDSHLPMYRPWPMFEAIRAANLNQTNCPWLAHPDLSKEVSQIPEKTLGKAIVSYVPGNGDSLANEMVKAGIKATAYSSDETPDVLLVDGSVQPGPEVMYSLQKTVSQVLAAGGRVWVWNIRPEGAAMVTVLAGSTVNVMPREASSFVVKQGAPLLAGLDNASLYFSEDDDWQQMTYSLNGEYLKEANVILNACPADWRKWNYQAEPVKTAALYRSEVERTAPLAAIAIHKAGNGQMILCNLSPNISSAHKLEVIQQMMRNEGVEVQDVLPKGGFLSISGQLVKALVCGSFPVTNLHSAYGEALNIGDTSEGSKLNSHRWKVRTADAHGVFDFLHYSLEGPQSDATAYVIIWIKSPKPLDDLLSEPNLPKLSFTYGSDDGCQIWLNGKLLANNERTGPLDPDMFMIKPLLLKLGWNELVIKVVQAEGQWQFAGKFSSTDNDFLSKLEFDIKKHDDVR